MAEKKDSRLKAAGVSGFNKPKKTPYPNLIDNAAAKRKAK